MIIKVENLVKSYNDLEAVKGISFSVNKGDFFAFLGPNGAGKSTTINIICTLLSKNSGTVIIDGLEVGVDDNEIRKRIGVVFQNNILDNKLSVRQNLDIRGSFYGLKQTELNERIENIVSLLSIDGFVDQKYGTLSGGQRRKADIARALINQPKVLILDEPTTGLDPKTRKDVWDIISNLRKQDMTIFLTTHYMEEAANATKIIVIDNGVILAEGTPEELRNEYSYDRLRLFFKNKDIFDCLGDYEYEVLNDVIEIKVPSIRALEIINKVVDKIEAFEVVRGNMDDVFLNITGSDLVS